jgi:hypothetical protein
MSDEVPDGMVGWHGAGYGVALARASCWFHSSPQVLMPPQPAAILDAGLVPHADAEKPPIVEVSGLTKRFGPFEPRRVCRRLFGVSHAAIGVASCAA